MIYTSTVTQKGQITLPIYLRKALEIQTSDQVNITLSLKKNQIIIKKNPAFASLKGSLKSSLKKGLTPNEMDESFAKSILDEKI